MTPTKTAVKAKTDESHGFTDVSAQAAQAAEDAAIPVTVDSDGRPERQTSDAASVVAAELAHRSAASANGGGPWPPDILLKRFTGATPLYRGPGAYTSHEK